MELRHLRYFTAVVQWKGYREAWRRLHVAQPPISQTVADLEIGLAEAIARIPGDTPIRTGALATRRKHQSSVSYCQIESLIDMFQALGRASSWVADE